MFCYLRCWLHRLMIFSRKVFWGATSFFYNFLLHLFTMVCYLRCWLQRLMIFSRKVFWGATSFFIIFFYIFLQWFVTYVVDCTVLWYFLGRCFGGPPGPSDPPASSPHILITLFHWGPYLLTILLPNMVCSHFISIIVKLHILWGLCLPTCLAQKAFLEHSRGKVF